MLCAIFKVILALPTAEAPCPPFSIQLFKKIEVHRMQDGRAITGAPYITYHIYQNLAFLQASPLPTRVLLLLSESDGFTSATRVSFARDQIHAQV
jgi:hypothetical protein